MEGTPSQGQRLSCSVGAESEGGVLIEGEPLGLNHGSALKVSLTRPGHPMKPGPEAMLVSTWRENSQAAPRALISWQAGEVAILTID